LIDASLQKRLEDLSEDDKPHERKGPQIVS
jgi:hypothetical protein